MKLVFNQIVEVYQGVESEFVITRNQRGESKAYRSLIDLVEEIRNTSSEVPGSSK